MTVDAVPQIHLVRNPRRPADVDDECDVRSAAHGPRAGKREAAYRTMVMEHPQMAGMRAHNLAPQKVVVIVCYRMHGDSDYDTKEDQPEQSRRFFFFFFFSGR